MNRYLIIGFNCLISISIYFIVNWYCINNFDYCVIHICGMTHNYGIQDAIYTIVQFIPIAILFYAIYSIFFGDLNNKKVKQG